MQIRSFQNVLAVASQQITRFSTISRHLHPNDQQQLLERSKATSAVLQAEINPPPIVPSTAPS
jgi:hypothetical protein